MPRITISEPEKTPQPYRFKLERETILIGRGGDNDIILECGSASTKHCVIERVQGGFIMRDTDSTNGIKLGDTLMEVIDLFDGMEILIGDVPCTFQLSDDEIQTLAGEEFTTYQKKKLPPVKQEVYGQEPAAPLPPTPHVSPPQPAVQPTVQQSGGALKTLLLFILVLLAIFVGITIRHNQRTGDFLPNKLLGDKKEQTPQKPAAEQEPATSESADTSAE